LVLDFDRMNTYSVKTDYKRYGGKAYLRYNRDADQMTVVGVRSALFGAERIQVNPNSAAFRDAEEVILACMAMQCVVGKHCAGIHSYFNLVPIALSNAFDTHTPWENWTPHPFRVMMNIHFYNHIMTEELTTTHLLNKGSVFEQIFAMDQYGLGNFYNDTFNHMEFTSDADLETRWAQYGGNPTRQFSPNRQSSQLLWEQVYHDAILEYTTGLVDCIYSDDQEVCRDTELQLYKAELDALLPIRLPARHDFKTRTSVARHFADAVFCVMIRHEIYGTMNVKYGLDIKLFNQAVAIDGGTPSCEDYMSTMLVALATSRAVFTKMINGSFRYSTYLEQLPQYKRTMLPICEAFTKRLQNIQDEWTSTPEARLINADYLRVLSNDLETGAGY